jgi:uncharacterized protein YacL
MAGSGSIRTINSTVRVGIVVCVWSQKRTMTDYRLPFRLLGLIVGLIVGLTVGNILTVAGDSSDTKLALITIGLAIGGIGYLLGPHLSWAILRNARSAIVETSTVDIVAIAIGLTFGAAIAAALALPMSYLPDPAGTYLPIIVALASCGFSIAVMLMRKRDLVAPWLRTRGTKQVAHGPATLAPQQSSLLLDTNIIIDGRIMDVVETGFLEAILLVPQFVLTEVQHIADSDDPVRRVRGRRGLETLNALRGERPEKVKIVDDLVPEEREVDAKLIRLAKNRGCRILTNDFNLNRVAQLQDVNVLNLNELTNALRPLVLPGEEISLSVVQEGREVGQGVGFLDDGTMVVVDGGRRLVGQETAVTVTRLLQTGSGRMIFATPKHATH